LSGEAKPALADLAGLPEVREALAADILGHLLQCSATTDEVAAGQCALQTASVIRELEILGREAGLERLDSFVVRGASRSAVTVLRAGLFVRATVDPSHGTAQVERALGGWAPGHQADPAAAEPPAEESVGASDLGTSLAEAASRAAAAIDPWAELRRTLLRGQLTDASALRGRLVPDASGKVGPGAEPLDTPGRERAMDGLLEGIGSILSGDALGGLRTLKPFASPPHPNLSVRWLSLHWSALAALRCNGMAAARWYARESVLAARQLDTEAQAGSQWSAAEVLAAEGDGARALTWVSEARLRFERLRDPWGLARVCLSEARILAAMQREEEAVEAARRASAHDPGWDDPPVFLAQRALLRNALEEAQEAVRVVGTAAADRIRLLVDAVEQKTVSQADAAEVVRLQDALPTVDAMRALERIARASPRLVVVREALAWLLLKVGHYGDAGALLQGLAASPLTPAIRSSVMLGLGCVAHAQQNGQRPEARKAGAARGAEGTAASPPADGETTPRGAVSLLSSISGSAGAVFAGKLNVFAVPDLMEFLRGARRTGTLVCTSAAGTAALRFRDGRIAGAASPTTPGLGELLVRARKLSPVVLQAVLDRQAQQPRSEGLIGELLAREGLVDADDVKKALREQIELAVKEVVLWRDGEFAFNRQEGEEERSEIPVEADPQEVLLNVLKDMDEASRTRAVT
jgi:hypothetical protein